MIQGATSSIGSNDSMMNKLERYLAEHDGSMNADSNYLLRDVAYLRLKNAIRYAGLEPGTLLSEVRLSKVLGISRTPVREAVQQLAQEGLLEIIPGRAIIVPQLSIEGIRDIVHMRILLEPELARLVALVAAAEAVENLLGLCGNMEGAALEDDRIAWSKADTTFHEALCDSCPNELLAKTVRQMFNRTHQLATSSRTSQARLLACTREHLAVVQAISASDPQRAQQSMSEHLRLMQGNLLDEFGWKPMSYEVSEEVSLRA